MEARVDVAVFGLSHDGDGRRQREEEGAERQPRQSVVVGAVVVVTAPALSDNRGCWAAG